MRKNGACALQCKKKEDLWSVWLPSFVPCISYSCNGQHSVANEVIYHLRICTTCRKNVMTALNHWKWMIQTGGSKAAQHFRLRFFVSLRVSLMGWNAAARYNSAFGKAQLFPERISDYKQSRTAHEGSLPCRFCFTVLQFIAAIFHQMLKKMNKFTYFSEMWNVYLKIFFSAEQLQRTCLGLVVIPAAWQHSPTQINTNTPPARFWLRPLTKPCFYFPPHETSSKHVKSQTKHQF